MAQENKPSNKSSPENQNIPTGSPQARQANQMKSYGQVVELGFSGPIPPPAILNDYEKILPGAAERIIKMAEAQSVHRQAMEKKLIFSDTFQASCGMFFAFIIVISSLAGGVFLIANNKSVGGFISIITAIAVIITSFIFGRKEKAAAKEKSVPDIKIQK